MSRSSPPPSMAIESHRAPRLKPYWKEYTSTAVQAGPPPAVLSIEEERFFEALERPTTVGKSQSTRQSRATQPKKRAPSKIARSKSRKARAAYSSDEDDDSAITARARSAGKAPGSRQPKTRKRAKVEAPIPPYAELQRLAPTTNPLLTESVVVIDAAVQADGCEVVHGWYGSELGQRVRYREAHHFPPMPFPDVTHYEIETPDMVIFKHQLPPDCFKHAEPPTMWSEMRVGGFTRKGRYIVMSPNASYIPYFPEEPDKPIRWAVHEDGLYGAQEYTRVPRSIDARQGDELFCALIPRRPLDRSDPSSILWHDVAHWFCHAPDPLVEREDRYLLKPYIADALRIPIESIRRQMRAEIRTHNSAVANVWREDGADEATIAQRLRVGYHNRADIRHLSPEDLRRHYYDLSVAGHPYLNGLDTAIPHLFGFLQIHGMPLAQAQLAARELQRYCLEACGILNYIDAHNENVGDFKEFDPARPLRWVVGAFCPDLFTQQLLCRYRVPVWRAAEWTGSEGILACIEQQRYDEVPSIERLVTMTSPYRMACLSPHPMRLPYIFKGCHYDAGWLAKVHSFSCLRFRINAPLSLDICYNEATYDPLFGQPDVKDRESATLQALEYLTAVKPPPVPAGHSFETPKHIALDDDDEPPVETFPAEARPLPEIAGVETALDNRQEVDENQEALALHTPHDDEQLFSAEVSPAPQDDNEGGEVVGEYGESAAAGDAEVAPSVAVKEAAPTEEEEQLRRSATPVPQGADEPPSFTAPAKATTPAPAALPPSSPPRTTAASTSSAGPSKPSPLTTSGAGPAQSSWGRSEEHRQARKPKGIHFENREEWTTSTYDHRKALPTTAPAWKVAVDSHTQKWPVSQVRPGDAARCLPTPSMLVNPMRERKRASVVHTYILLLNMLLENARAVDWDDDLDVGKVTSGAPMPFKLLGKQWRLILWMENTHQADAAGPVARALEGAEAIFGGKLDIAVLVERLQLPYRIHGEVVQPGQLPTPDTLMTILWLLQETVFRKDLTDLDRRVRALILTRAQEAARLRRVFDRRTFWYGDILSVRGDGRINMGLVADRWEERIRYVLALVDIMESWCPPIWPEVVTIARMQPMRPSHAVWIENQVAMYYARMLRYELKRIVVPPPRRSTAVL